MEIKTTKEINLEVKELFNQFEKLVMEDTNKAVDILVDKLKPLSQKKWVSADIVETTKKTAKELVKQLEAEDEGNQETDTKADMINFVRELAED